MNLLKITPETLGPNAKLSQLLQSEEREEILDLAIAEILAIKHREQNNKTKPEFTIIELIHETDKTCQNVNELIYCTILIIQTLKYNE